MNGSDGVYPVPDTTQPSLFVAPAQIYEVHPQHGKGEMIDSGDLWIARAAPLPGEEVGGGNSGNGGKVAQEPIVGFLAHCRDTRFYVLRTDPCVKLSRDEYMIFMPHECIAIVLLDATDEDVRELDGILRELTAFRVEDDPDNFFSAADIAPQSLDKLFPDEPTARRIMRLSGWLCNRIILFNANAAEKVHAYGERQNAALTPSAKELSPGHIKRAAAVHSASERANRVVMRVSDKLSAVVGRQATEHMVVKQTDSARKRHLRQMAAAALLSYGQVAEAMYEGYGLLLTATREQASMYAANKYGEGADELVRHSTATAYNVASAALATRRVISVRRIVASNARAIAMNHAHNFAQVPPPPPRKPLSAAATAPSAQQSLPSQNAPPAGVPTPKPSP